MSQRRDGRPATGSPRELELRVNPIACDARGLCIELLPELISADPWGYPVIRPGPVPLRLMSLARRAVADCPTLALLLAERATGQPEPGQSRAGPGPVAAVSPGQRMGPGPVGHYDLCTGAGPGPATDAEARWGHSPACK